jgi:hypothetical protein
MRDPDRRAFDLALQLDDAHRVTSPRECDGRAQPGDSSSDNENFAHVTVA